MQITEWLKRAFIFSRFHTLWILETSTEGEMIIRWINALCSCRWKVWTSQMKYILITSWFFSEIGFTRLIVGNHEKQMRILSFLLFAFIITTCHFVLNSTWCYNFVNDFFLFPFSVFQIGILTPQETTRCQCRWF